MTVVEPQLRWRRSTYCDTSSCVEVASFEDGVAVRDSKDPESPILRFSKEHWQAFVSDVRAGRMDLD